MLAMRLWIPANNDRSHNRNFPMMCRLSTALMKLCGNDYPVSSMRGWKMIAFEALPDLEAL